ncbi:bcl-2-related ovarian killer protein-like isoform X1 [Hippocampus zosterae]|uniref:bcl-2-related ovarian killer protein-like isoform X1 n=1 Tax=Hippocampus zosterae TaxID=109293 RepID=UPI00223D856B|nr:bcl-2-related ovarian killer protein-like isoform X1 [Hippocampus zosterae]XP_051943421.1 bcl-2-related ovarian killer protein-like isoform X1 [Hippocampus zosterae]
MEVLRKSTAFAAEVLEVFDRSLSDKQLVTQAKALCRDFILSRLNQNGLTWSKSELNLSPCGTALSEVSFVLLCLGDELERILPSLYRNVARQLNISVAMETMVSDAFIAVATEIFSTGITWGKVVSMYAVAGALAVDCVKQGHASTVHVIVDSLGQFVRKYLAQWLKRRGGWLELTNCVVKKDLFPKHRWLSTALDSLRYFLTSMYVYIMKEG